MTHTDLTKTDPVAAAAITFNGRTYCRTVGAMLDTLFTGPRTADGLYKPHGSGVLLMRPNGSPFAFVSGNDGGFIVNASRLPDGRLYFMHGTDERTDDALGITGYRHGIETARAILAAA